VLYTLVPPRSFGHWVINTVVKVFLTLFMTAMVINIPAQWSDDLPAIQQVAGIFAGMLMLLGWFIGMLVMWVPTVAKREHAKRIK